MTATIDVYQCDDNGWLSGMTVAYESPLEPEVYMIPRNAVTEAPPAAPWPDGIWPRWVAGQWSMQAVPRPASDGHPMQKLRDFLAAHPDVLAAIQGGV